MLQSPKDRLEALQEFVPTAKLADWRLEAAGQRVQIIKKNPKTGGVLQFGTEVVAAKDGSVAALLGASPGASTAVDIMLGLIARCFPQRLKKAAWKARIKEMIPSYGESLASDGELHQRVHGWSADVLGLKIR